MKGSDAFTLMIVGFGELRFGNGAGNGISGYVTSSPMSHPVR